MKIRYQQSINPLEPAFGTLTLTARRCQRSAPPAPTDRVQLSNLAQLTEAYSDSEARIAQLSALSATVSSGRYHVAPEVVSHSIIEATLRLGGGNYN